MARVRLEVPPKPDPDVDIARIRAEFDASVHHGGFGPMIISSDLFEELKRAGYFTAEPVHKSKLVPRQRTGKAPAPKMKGRDAR